MVLIDKIPKDYYVTGVTYAVAQNVITLLDETSEKPPIIELGQVSQPIVGVIVAVTISFIILSAVFLTAYCYYKKKKCQRGQRRKSDAPSPAGSDSPLTPKTKVISPPARAKPKTIELSEHSAPTQFKSSVVALPPLLPTRLNNQLLKDRPLHSATEDKEHEELFDYVPPPRKPPTRRVADAMPRPTVEAFAPPDSSGAKIVRVSPTLRKKHAKELIDGAFPSPNAEVKRIFDYYADPYSK